jgi:hypothetical protein
MSGRAILAGIPGLSALAALMFANAAFMHGDPVEPSLVSESTE